MEPLLDAHITPNEGLGGLRLRTKLIEIQDLVTPQMYTDPATYQLVSPFEARYTMANGAIEVAVDVRNGKIFKLIAREGYWGKLFGTIAVGMLAADAMQIEPGLKYDEAEETIICEGVPGLAIDVPAKDPPAELVPTMTISAINVFAVEILTANGQRGHW
jgi:hypothetical protein